MSVRAVSSHWIVLGVAALSLAGLIGSSRAQDLPLPVVALGDAVVTGFSGVLAPDPAQPLPKGKSAIDITFIDADRPSARIFALQSDTFSWDASVRAPASTLDIPAADVGQVFGIALDDALAPNTYLTATSAFGLNIVVPGKTRSALPERTRTGHPRAVWMRGQFGLELQGGPGSIWKIDGETGEVSLFANVALNGVPNPGPALGNIAYDAIHRQLFVSDLYTGMIHRFDLDGTDLGYFDHGVDGRGAAGLAPVAFDPAIRPNIADPSFNSEDPATWDLAPPERRVWGLTVHDQRLFYAVSGGPQIWSVGIAPDGSFAGDPRWELDLPTDPVAYSVSDMTFTSGGAMILAERAPLVASYDYADFTAPSEPRVLVYWPETPDDPQTPSLWMAVPEEYAVGFGNESRRTNGGVDLGYGYDDAGLLDTGACEASLWTTGQNLRHDESLADDLLPGGALIVDGVQASPSDRVRNANTPPWLSAYVDYDDAFSEVARMGHMGSVRVLKEACGSILAGEYVGPPYIADPPYTGGGGEDCTDTACESDLPVDLAIAKTAGAVTYDENAGVWTIQFTLLVTNAGAAFAPNNAIAIHDPVPSGTSLVSAVGAGWTACTGNLDCTYPFSGVFASGASLPPLVVTVTTKEPGKYENCASVGTTPDSGLIDVAPDNNKACAVAETVDEPKSCFASKGSFTCDAKTGLWVYELSVDGPSWMNSITALSQTPGVVVSPDPLALSPAMIGISGPAGSSAVVDVCGFDAAAEASGNPYDCCRARFDVTLPTGICEKQP